MKSLLNRRWQTWREMKRIHFIILIIKYLLFKGCVLDPVVLPSTGHSKVQYRNCSRGFGIQNRKTKIYPITHATVSTAWERCLSTSNAICSTMVSFHAQNLWMFTFPTFGNDTDRREERGKKRGEKIQEKWFQCWQRFTKHFQWMDASLTGK